MTNLVFYSAFEMLHLSHVDLRVFAYTERAVNCCKKCCYVQGGIEREGALIDKKYETDLLMRILDREDKANRR